MNAIPYKFEAGKVVLCLRGKAPQTIVKGDSLYEPIVAALIAREYEKVVELLELKEQSQRAQSQQNFNASIALNKVFDIIKAAVDSGAFLITVDGNTISFKANETKAKFDQFVEKKTAVNQTKVPEPKKESLSFHELVKMAVTGKPGYHEYQKSDFVYRFHPTELMSKTNSELVAIYNNLIVKFKLRKTVSKFRDKKTGIVRVLELQKYFFDRHK